MIANVEITKIFCPVDECCKEYDHVVEKNLLGNPSKRPPVMSRAEVITIMVLGLVAYCFLPKKPSLKFEFEKDRSTLSFLIELRSFSSIR